METFCSFQLSAMYVSTVGLGLFEKHDPSLTRVGNLTYFNSNPGPLAVGDYNSFFRSSHITLKSEFWRLTPSSNYT